MPFFSDEWIHELHTKVNIVDLIGEYVTLQNKSGRWWACCPFHNEKTPSFTVNADKGFFHCFGCGKGGNAIHFVMEMENMTFPEACTYLAEKVNMPIPAHTDNAQYEKRKAERNKVYEINKAAAHFFHQSLYDADAAHALAYLRGRGLDEKVIRTFGLGYAKDSWDSLMKHLEAQGFTKGDMQLAGLIKMNEGKQYDAFRNRVIMPIINSFSEVIGFGGRVLDDSLPKYLNSPETPAFNKSRNLYNLNMIRKQKNLQYLILVEGYMDVIALYSHGIANAVATLGTALTTEQARLAKRYVSTVYVSYDGDSAGQKATLRALDILEKEGLECRVMAIPGGQDPDDYLKKHKKQGYMQLLKSAKPVLDYKFDVAAEAYDLTDGLQKEKYAKDCIAILKTVDSAVLKEKYAKNLSARTGFSEHSIMQDVGISEAKTVPVYKPEKAEKPKKLTAPMKAENYVAALLCANPERALHIGKYIAPDELLDPANKKIFLYILESVKKGFSPQGDEILSVLTEKEEVDHAVKLLSSNTDIFSGGKQADSFLADCIKRIKIRNKENELDDMIQKSREELGDDEKKEVRERIRGLTKELHELKEKLSGVNEI